MAILFTPAIEGLFTYVVATTDFLYRFNGIGLPQDCDDLFCCVFFLFIEVIRLFLQPFSVNDTTFGVTPTPFCLLNFYLLINMD